MKYVRNIKNPKIVKEIADNLVSDYIATKEWEETYGKETKPKSTFKIKPKDVE